jgi:peptidoglycan L-alanyl-D-glutamate endopeptidase CwlK
MGNPIPHAELARALGVLLGEKKLAQVEYLDLLHMTTYGVLPAKSSQESTTTAASTQAVINETGFKFGATSQKNLAGVKKELAAVAALALTKYTTQDFMCFDGLRTIEEQRRLVATGKSKTMNSMHLPQKDGFSHAMDLVPVNDKGQPVWDWKMIYPVVLAVDQAATQLGYAQNIVWGGAWDRRLSDFGYARINSEFTFHMYEQEVKAYCQRHAGSDFIDGPHFEWRD